MDRNWMYSVLLRTMTTGSILRGLTVVLHHLQHKAKETTIMNKPDGSIVLALQ